MTVCDISSDRIYMDIHKVKHFNVAVTLQSFIQLFVRFQETYVLIGSQESGIVR